MTQLEQERSVRERVEDLWHEGMARHVLIRKDERVPVDVPLNLVVLGTLFAPWLVATGAVIGLVQGYHIEMQGEPESTPGDTAGTEPADAASPDEFPAFPGEL
jgi:hypothetical protein